MPAIPLTGTNGVLRFGTAAVTEPMSFLDANRQVVGFDVEFATYIARKLGKQLEITDMEFGAMLPALIAGKVDIIGAGLSITEERAKKVLFSLSYYPSGIAAVVRGTATPPPVPQTVLLGQLSDIADKKIGVLLGSVHDHYANKNYPAAKIFQYQNVADLLIALNSKKVDAIFYDQASVPDILSKNPDLAILAKDVFILPMAAGFNQNNDQLRDQFNAFLKEIKSNGTYQDMITRWMDKGITAMPDIPAKTGNGVLRTGVVNDLGMPFAFVQEGKLAGFDIELSSRFASQLGMEYVPVPLQFGSLIASISTNKIDIITASMIASEERKKQIDFSDPYHETGVTVLTRKECMAPVVSGKYSTMDDLADKRLGIFTGTVYDGFLTTRYPGAEISRFEGTADLILSLKTGKIDAAIFDLVTARLILKHNAGLALLSDDLLSMALGVGFNKKNPDLRDEFNEYLREIRADGTYNEMCNRWFIEDAEEAVMPEFPKSISPKKLVAGVSVDDLPYVALMQGKYVGFDIEMIRRFGDRKNYDIEIVMMEFPSLVTALAAGKVDMISDGIAITEERGRQIDFSDPYADLGTAVLVKADNRNGHSAAKVAPPKKSFLKKFTDSFYSNIILEQRYLLILNGLLITILISILAAVLGTMLGGLVCFMKMSDRKILSTTAGVYIALLRGTPVLVLLMIIYYIVFASVNINPALVAVIAFGLNFGAYTSEMFRTSILSVDKGQKEAGIAGGFTKVQTFVHIISPQALRHLLPVYKGEFISLVKMTSIVGYIAVQDLTKASDIIRSRTFDAFFPLIMAAVLYLIIAWGLTWALGKLEWSVDPRRKGKIRVKEVKS
jgi:polar amino acid transport system substrate-binding protein